MGHIGKALGNIKSEKTNLQKELKKIVSVAFIIAIALCIITFFAYSIIVGNRIQ